MKQKLQKKAETGKRSHAYRVYAGTCNVEFFSLILISN